MKNEKEKIINILKKDKIKYRTFEILSSSEWWDGPVEGYLVANDKKYKYEVFGYHDPEKYEGKIFDEWFNSGICKVFNVEFEDKKLSKESDLCHQKEIIGWCDLTEAENWDEFLKKRIT